MTTSIMLDLEGLEYVTIMHDSWTSMANRCYETVAVHYINQWWQLQGKVLSTLVVEGSHTSEAIQKALLEVKTKWRLPEFFAVTDSAANEVKAFSLLKWPRAPCFGHNLNLSVRAGLAIPEVARVVATGYWYAQDQAGGTLPT